MHLEPFFYSTPSQNVKDAELKLKWKVCISISDVRYQDFYFDTISIRYWDKYRNFNSIFDNFNCVGGVISWTADLYKYA